MMSTSYIDPEPLVADLTRLHDLTAAAPREADFVQVTTLCDDVVQRLTEAGTSNTPPPADALWLATKTPDGVMVVGPGLFLLSASDESSVSIVSDGASWTVRRDHSGLQITHADDAGLRSWTVPPEGTRDETDESKTGAADDAWHPTHRVGRHSLPVGSSGGAVEPGTTLDPGLPVRVLDATSSGWVFVECANGWRCYVPAWGLEPIGCVHDG